MTQYNLGHVVGSTGATGATGNGISSITKTGTSGLVDTYTITFTNGQTTTFTVTNGSNATVTIVDNLTSDSSTSVLSAKQGKVLNTNKVETSAIKSSFSSNPSDSNIASEKLVKNSLDGKLDKASSDTGFVKSNGTIVGFGTTSTTVAAGNHTHSVGDISDPDADDYTNIGDLVENDNQAKINREINTTLGNKIDKSNTVGLVKNDGTVMTSGTGSTNWAVGNHTHSAYVNPTIVDNLTSDSSTSVLSAKQGKVLNTNKIETSAIVDNLTTNDATKVLSAKQGKVLNDLIGSAITYITGSGS